MSEWFREVYGYEPFSTTRPRLPIATFTELNGAEVTFLEPEPRIVQTKFGGRAVINISINGIPKALFLSRVQLAAEVALLQDKLGSLENVTVKIEEQPRQGRIVPYKVTVLKQAKIDDSNPKS